MGPLNGLRIIGEYGLAVADGFGSTGILLGLILGIERFVENVLNLFV
jgi:hypothetical protein